MERLSCTPRPHWRERVEALGFDFHTIEGAPYWDERAYWRFDSTEIDLLDDVATELHGMCMAAVERVMERGDFDRMGISGLAAELAWTSWRRHDRHLYGRFDLAWTGDGHPKLLEYNADTPTSLFEAAVVQWQWLQDFAPSADQFNSIHEALVARWGEVALGITGRTALHMACIRPHAEDEGTVGYLQATALEAGLSTKKLGMDEIGWDGRDFVDLQGNPIRRLFKLYPWEWMAGEDFAAHLAGAAISVIEPAWKLVLSSKALLAVLWEMFPGHPNLLPAAFTPEGVDAARLVRKPLFSREGANIQVIEGDRILAETDGPYGNSAVIWQAWAELAGDGEGGHSVLGAWMVGDKCHGLGIREDSGIITRDSSRFLPHLFQPD